MLPTLKLQARVNSELQQRPPDAVVLIDYMGANVRLGKRLRQQLPEVPITYYIAPQEWAWSMNDGGTTSLLEFTDRILAIFPDEPRFMSPMALRSPGWAIPWWTWPLIHEPQRSPPATGA